MKSQDGPATSKSFRINVQEVLSNITHDTEMESLEPRVKLTFEKRDEKLEERLSKMEEKIESIYKCVCDEKLLDETERFKQCQP